MINTADRAELEAATKITGGGRGAEELLRRLRERIDLLLERDRLLVEMVLCGAFSRRRAGELLNLEPGTVTRRLQKVCARLHDPIVSDLMDPRCPLSPDYRQVGVEHFLTGLSSAKLAAKHSMRAAEVRRMLQFIRGWHRGLCARGRM